MKLINAILLLASALAIRTEAQDSKKGSDVRAANDFKFEVLSLKPVKRGAGCRALRRMDSQGRLTSTSYSSLRTNLRFVLGQAGGSQSPELVGR